MGPYGEGVSIVQGGYEPLARVVLPFLQGL